MIEMIQMHPIRKDIIFKLIVNHTLPYSKIKPPTIEGNLFIYHLKQLINEGLVQKSPNGQYELTKNGQMFADRVSLETLRVRAQPKIVTLVICQNSKGEYLLYQRNRQPFFGLIGFPSGKIHLGENVQQAATRELKESTGLKSQLTHRGMVYLLIFEDKSILTHRLYHIFTATSPVGKLIQDAKFGHCFWQQIKDPSDKKFMTGFKEILELIQKPSKGLFFAEYTFNL